MGWEAIVRDRVVQRAALGGGAHRGALEPRPIRRPPRGEGLPRYAAPPRAGVFHPPMSSVRHRRPSRRRCESRRLVAPPLRAPALRHVRPSRMVRQAASRPVHPLHLVGASDLHGRFAGGPSFSASTHAAAAGRRLLLRHRRGGGPDVGHRFDRAVATGDRERTRPPSATGSSPVRGGRGSPPTRCGRWCNSRSGTLAIPRLHLFVEPWNAASARTAEAAGFDREATLRGWERHRRRAARRRLLHPALRRVDAIGVTGCGGIGAHQPRWPIMRART